MLGNRGIDLFQHLFLGPRLFDTKSSNRASSSFRIEEKRVDECFGDATIQRVHHFSGLFRNPAVRIAMERMNLKIRTRSPTRIA